MDRFNDWLLYGLALLGGVAVLVNGLKSLGWLVSPVTNLKMELAEQEKMIETQRQRLKEGDARFQKQEAEMQEIKSQVSVIGIALAELINHTITGNDTDKLKEQQDNLLKAFMK